MPKTWEEQRRRLESMCGNEQQLSAHDEKAIRAALARIDELDAIRAALARIAKLERELEDGDGTEEIVQLKKRIAELEAMEISFLPPQQI